MIILKRMTEMRNKAQINRIRTGGQLHKFDRKVKTRLRDACDQWQMPRYSINEENAFVHYFKEQYTIPDQVIRMHEELKQSVSNIGHLSQQSINYHPTFAHLQRRNAVFRTPFRLPQPTSSIPLHSLPSKFKVS